MRLLYEEHISKSLKNKIIKVAKKMGINPNWFMPLIWRESRFNPAAVNKHTGATGLIQFMPSTAKGLGTSVQALRKMSAEQQMDYVYKFYKPYRKSIKSYVDLCMATFMPISLNKPMDWVFHHKKASAAVVARQNAPFDTNKDGKITKFEFIDYLMKDIPAGWKEEILGQYAANFNKVKRIEKNKSLPIIGILALIASGFIAYKIINKNDNKNTKS